MTTDPLSLGESWAPEVNKAFGESVLQGGCDLNKVPVGGFVILTTRQTRYVIEKLEDGFKIAGNDKYCPVPTKCTIMGSVFHREGSMIRSRWLGRGMFMEFGTAAFPRLISSEITDVVEI